jgi:hypothetical protein
MPQTGAKDNSLIGAWRLLSWGNHAADGQVTYPAGPDAVGYLIYSADGRFSVTIGRANRAQFAVPDILGGTVEEKVAAIEGFIAYAGRYRFLGDRVVHHVELSLFPNWAGTDQERTADFSGDRLTLSVGPILLAGKPQTARLTWERASPDGA